MKFTNLQIWSIWLLASSTIIKWFNEFILGELSIFLLSFVLFLLFRIAQFCNCWIQLIEFYFIKRYIFLGFLRIHIWWFTSLYAHLLLLLNFLLIFFFSQIIQIINFWKSLLFFFFFIELLLIADFPLISG